MFNIIKSLNYSARRDTPNWITIISLLLMPFFILFLSGMMNSGSTSEMTPSLYYASSNLGTVFVFSLIGVMILGSKLVAGDAADKTLNYELMAGHSRTRVFTGRMISGFLWGTVLVFIIFMLPVGLFDLIYGWGPETVKGEVLLRCVLTFFTMMRYCAYVMMLATVTRSAGKGIALGYATMMIIAIVQSILEELLKIVIVYPTAFTNGCALLIATNSKYVVENGKQVCKFDTAVTGEMIWKTIGVSILFTVIYMVISYINFKKTDRD